jgi:hypothetical protein
MLLGSAGCIPGCLLERCGQCDQRVGPIDLEDLVGQSLHNPATTPLAGQPCPQRTLIAGPLTLPVGRTRGTPNKQADPQFRPPHPPALWLTRWPNPMSRSLFALTAAKKAGMFSTFHQTPSAPESTGPFVPSASVTHLSHRANLVEHPEHGLCSPPMERPVQRPYMRKPSGGGQSAREVTRAVWLPAAPRKAGR